MHTQSARLERWLGKAEVESVSRAMRDFYWPIAMHGVPGRVFAMPGGDFRGELTEGYEASAMDRAEGILRRAKQHRNATLAAHMIMTQPNLQARLMKERHAFASVNALVAAATGGKSTQLVFTKTGSAASAIGNAMDLWTSAGQPGAGAAASAAPGAAFTSASAGALPFTNPGNANTNHFTTGYVTGSVVANTLLLYDRLFGSAKTMNSFAIEQVGGSPTRYQTATSTSNDYIGGNFCFPSVPTTVLAATAHNWVAGVTSSPNQGCCYTNQAGVEAGFQLGTGVSACPQHGIDLAVGSWFLPLQTGDVGVKKLNTMQCSAAVATGTIDFILGHPIALFPCPVANMVCTVDGLYTAFNLATILDSAALGFLELPKPATTATTYSGLITMVSE